jgi:hypothetical protein
VVEVETGLAVLVTEGCINGELAGCLIEAHEVEAMDAIRAGGDNDAAGGRIPAGPMGEVVAGEGDARDLDRLFALAMSSAMMPWMWGMLSMR